MKTSIFTILFATAAVLMAANSARASVSVAWTAPPNDSIYEAGTIVTLTGQASAAGAVGGTGLDLALVIDASNTMNTKNALAVAKEAAIALVNALPVEETSVTLVQFNRSATLLQPLSPLTSDKAAVIAAINGITTKLGTRIGEGIELAAAELTSPRHTQGRSRQMVVLSDGAQTAGIKPHVAADNSIAAGVDAIHAVGVPGHKVPEMKSIVAGPDGIYGNEDDYGVYTSGALDELIGLFSGTGGNLVGIDRIELTLPDGTTQTVPTDGLGNFSTPTAWAVRPGEQTWVAIAYDTQGNSALASLTLFGSESLVITGQPADQMVFAGETATFNVVAIGAAPLKYQWYREGSRIIGEVNPSLLLEAVEQSDAGDFWVVVSNLAGEARSRSATLTVQVRADEVQTPGTIVFANREVACGLNAPVYDLDGVTPVVGDEYVVELWAGPSAATMQPIATTGFRASCGYFGPGSQPVSIPTVEAGSVAHVQVRVWDTQGGVAARYEEAEQRNLKRAVSSVFTVVTGNEGTPPTLPACLLGLESMILVQDRGVNPPAIVGGNNRVTGLEGGYLTLTWAVRVTGDQPMTYTWYHVAPDGRTTPLDSTESATLRLEIDVLSSAFEGDYYLSVSNAGGTAERLVGTLIVIPRPSEDSRISQIQCRPDGTPVIRIPTHVGLGYRLQVSDDLVHWQDAGELHSGSGGLLELLDPTANGQPQRFYRVLTTAE
jgi:Ca-activated chloride channel homolog